MASRTVRSSSFAIIASILNRFIYYNSTLYHIVKRNLAPCPLSRVSSRRGASAAFIQEGGPGVSPDLPPDSASVDEAPRPPPYQTPPSRALRHGRPSALARRADGPGALSPASSSAPIEQTYPQSGSKGKASRSWEGTQTKSLVVG
jgi:hypothetical protein